MAYSFGDSFDLYGGGTVDSASGFNGYWDGGSASAFAVTTVLARFSGQSLQLNSTAPSVFKNSGQNDAVHHIVVAFHQSATLGTSALGTYFQLSDGATAQCSIVFNRNGTITLTSGGPAGTVLATYASAFTVVNTWYAFEFEVVINSTTGSFKVRKNGNTTEDFTATALNTRGGTANNYANRLTVGQNATVGSQYLDDLFWKSDASSVAWLGDIRCYTRMPATDQSVQFSRLGSMTQTPGVIGSTSPVVNTVAYYVPVIPTVDGTLASVTIQFNPGYTGNLKCTLFNGTSSTVTTIIASATTLVNPATGTNVMTFPSPPTLVKGGSYWLGVIADTASGNFQITSTTIGRFQNPTTYAAFPAVNPAVGGLNGVPFTTFTMTPTTNNSLVNEAQQDAATSYVYSSNPGDADFYGIGSIAATPATVLATVTRAYMQKSDAGTRTAAVQVKSGGTTVASPTLALSTSGWQWAWRMDLVDPATSAAWTAAAVNSVTIGPAVVA